MITIQLSHPQFDLFERVIRAGGFELAPAGEPGTYVLENAEQINFRSSHNMVILTPNSGHVVLPRPQPETF
jgi:hypothetical protein